MLTISSTLALTPTLRRQRSVRPDEEATRTRGYALYEKVVGQKNSRTR
jgi:hypothetical protein